MKLQRLYDERTAEEIFGRIRQSYAGDFRELGDKLEDR